MHVQFEFTQEDMFDASRRSLARSEAVRSWRLKGLLYTAVFSWLLVFLFFFLLQQPVKGAVVGLIAAVISVSFTPAHVEAELIKGFVNFTERNSVMQALSFVKLS